MKGLYKLFWLLLLSLPIVSVAQTSKRGQDRAGSRCSLTFEYADAPHRPVSEFVARIANRDKSKNYVSDQKCTDKMEYEPGNYHVTVNTFPQTERNLDIDFDETIIMIPQPGFVKFEYREKTTTVILYKWEEYSFLAFDTLNRKNLETQPFRIQPGKYQAHYHIINGDQSGPEKIASFSIKATKEKIVKLK